MTNANQAHGMSTSAATCTALLAPPGETGDDVPGEPVGDATGGGILDPHDRVALAFALAVELHNLGVTSRIVPPGNGCDVPLIRTKRDLLTQEVALDVDPERPGDPEQPLYAWFWVWPEGSRGNARDPSVQRFMPAEDITEAAAKIAKVLGVAAAP